jgi:alcohol dehydrogenase
MNIWQFATAGSIKFGRGSLELTVSELQRYQVNRPLLVCDKVVLSLPGIAKLIADLRSANVNPVIFDGCEAEPPTEIADAAIQVGVDGEVDSVLGVGGGSNMDVAKVASIVLKHGGKPSDYFGFDKVPGPTLPMIAIPTTAGTGSEVSHSAVLTDASAAVKVSSLSRWLRPAAAIVDPSLTDSCPPHVTAHSGIDALVHAIEAATNRDYTKMEGYDPRSRAYEGSYPFTTMIAAEAIRLVGCSLVTAYKEPKNLPARDNMALAAMLGGMAFSNSGVAIVHALEYPVGAQAHCSHGEGNGLLLPHVMRFNLPACTERMAMVATWLGKNTQGLSHHAAAELAIEVIVELQQAVGIRTRLSQLGIDRGNLPAMAKKSFQIKRLMDVNPRLPTEAELLGVLEAAF